MKLLIGLGNPGEKYKNNRHNVGQMFVNWVKKRDSFSEGVSLVKTDCFMNESGKFVRRELRNSGIKELSQLYVVHDDLDLPLGSGKMQFGVGPKVHYGINSVEEALGTKDFWRVRIGVDARKKESRKAGEKYVLEDFTKEELKILEGVFDAILKDNSFPR